MPPTDIAIIGLACRFPGATNPRRFWRLLHDGLEVTTPLDNVTDFDADFFNLSPREACAMDPRQRLALELTWELLEDALLVPESLRGKHVSVYLGAMNDDYAFLTLRDSADDLDHHSFAGMSRGMMANRISYAFGMQGPSMTVDSGQSSSLVAVHLACESLRAGESVIAVAGGVHLNLAAETERAEREFGATSATGHTYAFDERADGYIRGEGGGLVLLKPLGAALDDHNRIRAVIRGSAVGNAGHTANALTVPSMPGQAEVIRRALFQAGLDISDVDYIEAHGTGTKIGDPIEARALGELFSNRQDRPVSVGSVKTNIGHSGGAAGIAGLLKTVLAIEHSVIPPSLNYAIANPDVDLAGLGLHVNTTLTSWPGNGPHRAGVSSFGMGGTNAHVIVEQAPAAPVVVAHPRQGDPEVPWVVSAKAFEALAGQATQLADYLVEHPELDVTDVGWSLVSTRSVFEHRAVVVGADREQLIAGLTGLASNEPNANVVVGQARAVGKTVFVFPGQGSQYLGMGAQLCRRFPIFAQAFDAAVAALDPHLRVPLRQVVWGNDPALLQSTEFAQPALFAVEVALASLLQHWGLVPDFVMGHSVGEIAAACVAGVLSLADAARVIAARGRLMAELAAGGVMVAVAASEAEVIPLLDDGVEIAAVNGPNSVVLSGAGAAVVRVADRLLESGRRVHRLAVSHAFHSALMEPMLAEFSRVLATISVAAPRIALISNLTGEQAGPGYGSESYWLEHVRRPVRFGVGVKTVESGGAGLFVEAGPGAVLSAAVEDSLSGEHGLCLPVLAGDCSEAESVLSAVGRAYAAGARVDWSGPFAGLQPRPVELPTYAFLRQRFWLGATQERPSGRSDATLAKQLLKLSPEERRRELLDLVRSHAALVLGHPSGRALDAARPFQDLGFDSLSGVELRNRLQTATGLTRLALPRTLIFDYPTPTQLADYLGEQLARHSGAEPDHSPGDQKIWSLLRKIPLRELRRTGLLDRLLLLAGGGEDASAQTTVSEELIDSLSPEALIAMALDPDDDEHEHR